ncbi:MAG TPA: hypothetical protein VHU84_09175 [Lacipirellulaceae bacterium]|nr:hypothetical protein [Lacipirellulaceae bacterium]
MNSSDAPGRSNAPHREPLARLIENPDQTAGSPPYALTDQNGTVQRYVEPVPGVDLESHVGQIVSVRSDTGPTLLASQLDLPRQMLPPLAGQTASGRFNGELPVASRRVARNDEVQQAQYVEGDDSTVQMLPDDMPMNNGTVMGPGTVQPLGMMGNGEYGAYPGQMMPGGMCGPGCEQQFCDPMQGGPGMMGPYLGPMVGPYPQGGGYSDGPAYGPNVGNVNLDGAEPQGVHAYGDVEFNFFRPRISEDSVGKLSETYELSPRFILGLQGIGAVDARVRFWDYGRTTNVLGDGNVRLKLDVWDIEALHRFEGKHSQLALSGGIRLANFKLKDDAGESSEIDMIGLTMAADGLTKCNCIQNGYCGWVYGGRLSLLGGDWGGDDNSVLIDHQVRDDNVVVTELYAGAEVGRRFGNIEVHGRVVFEIQNWRSDVLAQDANIQSVSFLGPGLQIGADF